jgi:hypothetical protein
MKEDGSSDFTKVRLDMVDTECFRCPGGRYFPTSLYDSIDQLVLCDVCHHETHRWKTKREILETAHKVERELLA